MNRSTLIFIGLALAASAAAMAEVPDAEHYTIDIEFRRWGAGLDAQIQKSADDAEGSLIDLSEDLGVEDHGTWELRGTIRLGEASKLRVGWTPIDYDGDKEVERQLRFGGSVYEAGTRVITSLKGNYFTGEFEWNLARGKWGYFGPIIGVKGFDGDTVLVAPEIKDRRIESFHIPVPVLGLTTRVYFGRLSVGGEVSGLTIGERGHLYELDLNGRFDLTPRIGFEAGYRRLKMHGSQDLDLLDFTLSGLHVGANVRF